MSSGVLSPLMRLKWAVTQSWGSHAIKLLVLLGLVRFVMPEDFGLFALAAGTVNLLQLLVNQGMSGAIVQRLEIEPGHVAAAFQRIAVLSLVLMLVVAGGGFLASHFRQSQIGLLVSVLAFGMPLDAFAALGLALLRRKLDFRKIALTITIAEAAGGAVAMLLAFDGWGVWSLVARQLVALCTMAGLAACWSADIRFLGAGRQHHREIAASGRMIALGNGLVMLRDRIDEPLVGILVGVEALGFYALARRLVTNLVAVVPSIIANLSWPLFASLQNDRHRLGESLLAASEAVGYIVWPIFAVFAITSAEWAPIILGSRWNPALPVIAALSVVSAVRALLGIQLLGLVATGHSRLRFWIEAMTTVAMFSAMYAFSPFGPQGVAWSAAGMTLLIAPLELMLIVRVLPISLPEYADSVRRAGAVTLFLGCALVLPSLWDFFGLSPVWRLCLLAFAAIVFYAVALRLFAREFTTAALEKFFRERANIRAAKPSALRP